MVKVFSIRFTEHAEKQLKNITERNKMVKALMEKAFTTLQSINIRDALKAKKIKIVSGLSGKSINFIKKINCEPIVFEYRNFPKNYPYRIYFIKCKNTLLLLRIFHHQDIKKKLAKKLNDSIESLKYMKLK